MSAGVAFVLFFLSFPRPVPHFIRISAILSMGTLGFTVLQAAWDFSSLWLPTMVDAALWIWFAANLTAAVIILAVRASRPANRQQFTPIVVGCVVGTLPIICLTAIPYLINHSFMVRPEVSAVGAVAVPLSFAYAILRHHLFGLDALLRRFLIWLAEAAAIAAVAGAAWVGVVRLGGGAAAIAAAAVFLGLVTPILIPRVMLAVDSVFYPTIARARDGFETPRAGGLTDLGVQLTRTTREVLPTRWAALVIRGARAGDTLERLEWARCRVVAVDGAVPTICPKLTTWVGPALHLAGTGLAGCTVVRLESNGTNLGALIVGPRLDDSPMTGIDREALDLLAGRSVVSVEAALLREQAEEEERYRQGLAAFARDLALAGSTEEVLEITVQHARRILDAGGAAIWQRDAAAVFRLASFDGDIGTANGEPLSPPVEAVRDAPVAASEPRDLGLAGEASLMAFRLDGSDRLDAVGALIRSAELGPFGPRDARRAAEVVEYASGALGRARAVATAAEAETLREINRVRTEIFDMVSHDLQSPLTVVRGYAELLQIRGDAIDPAFVDEAAESILTAYRSCQSLIDDLLTSARLEKGRLTLNSVELDPREVLQDLVAGHRVVPGGERLELHAPEGLRIRADRTRLEQMVGNLVSNALHYAPHGAIELRVHAMEGEALAAIEVRDHGPGIGPADLPRVWEKFYRSGAEQTTPRGAGVGLSVVRALAELHGGRAEVESALGEGTRFRICLPVAPSKSQEPGVRSQKADGYSVASGKNSSDR